MSRGRLQIDMTFREIEERVAAAKALEGGEFLFELLHAYGIPKASITRLRTGPMPLSCGAGEDHPAGEHPDAEKRSLEAEHCDLATREPFIVALARLSRAQR